jgi:O-acetyl-ADP-ribose deacetylase (regulator of RNase III)
MARIELALGDITDAEVDAVVNAANNQLQLGSGVAGAIRRKGGPSIQAECDRIGPVPLGEAAITGAGRLKVRYVIHAASMSLGQATTAEHLVASTKSSLLRADEHRLRSVAFPAIGTGVAGFPLDECARRMITTVREHLDTVDSSLERVLFVLYDQAAYDAFKRALEAPAGGK